MDYETVARSDCPHGLGDRVSCEMCRSESALLGAPHGAGCDVFRIGAAVVSRNPEVRTEVRGAWEDRNLDAEVSVWEVEVGPEAYRMDLEFLRWVDGTLGVQARARCDLERFLGLHRRITLKVDGSPQGWWWSSLRNQARYDPAAPDRPIARTPTLEQLADGAEIEDPIAEVERLGGALTRRDQVGPVKRGKDALVVVGDEGNEAVHVANFVLTRILPVYHRYEG